jgi:hypothetical protein
VRRRLALILALALVLSVGACGDEESSNSGAGGEPPKQAAPDSMPTEDTPTGAAKFSGQDRSNYEQAEVVCGAFPPKKVARDLGLNVNVHTSEGLVRIAEKYAEGYRPNFRQAVFEAAWRACRIRSGRA